MDRAKLLLVIILSSFGFSALAAVHTGQLEVSTFLGRQHTQKDGNATFSGGLQLGLEVVEIGTIEFSAETGFGSYPDNNRRVGSFDIALKKAIYNGELFLPHMLCGIGLMTYNRTGDKKENEATVTFAKTTVNFGIGFKIRIKKDFYAKLDQKFFLFTKDDDLTYRSLTAMGVSYSF